MLSDDILHKYMRHLRIMKNGGYISLGSAARVVAELKLVVVRAVVVAEEQPVGICLG